MSGFITHTWNPVIGCLHNCVYCMARGMAKRFAEGSLYADKYSRLSNAKGGSFILLCDKADLFGNWASDEWIKNVINAVRDADPSITFLFLTKNPTRYHDFVNMFPENCLLGATIETNRDEEYEKYSKAPKPSERNTAMKNLNFPRKFISIEPVMDLDPDIFENWIRKIAPEMSVIGYEPRPSDLLKAEMIEEKNEMYCWNCGMAMRVGRVKVVSEVGDKVPEPSLVTCCLECGAILEPKLITCYLCKNYSKTFYTGLFMHGGLMYHALCEKCRETVKRVVHRRWAKSPNLALKIKDSKSGKQIDV